MDLDALSRFFECGPVKTKIKTKKTPGAKPKSSVVVFDNKHLWQFEHGVRIVSSLKDERLDIVKQEYIGTNHHDVYITYCEEKDILLNRWSFFRNKFEL